MRSSTASIDPDALMSANQVCDLLSCAPSYWHSLVADGRAPQPVLRRVRFTRWRRRDVLSFIEREGEAEAETAIG